jgi:tetrathionate reductase subunit B
MKFWKLNLDKLGKKGPIPEIDRREMLKIGLIVTGAFAGGSILSAVSSFSSASASEFEERYPYRPHYAMLMHQDRCIDCELCVEACKKTNGVPYYGYRTKVMEHDDMEGVGQKRQFVPVLCNQCNNPPCVRACPTAATIKDPVTGIVIMRYERCIGCKTCMSACPYNARYFNEEKHAIDKCNFCLDTRLSKGEKLTACAAACPTGCRIFGDLSDPSSEVFKAIHTMGKAVWVMRPETGAKPNVFYTIG